LLAGGAKDVDARQTNAKDNAKDIARTMGVERIAGSRWPPAMRRMICAVRSVGAQGLGGIIGIAFPEVKRDLVERALLPLFGFREPENLTLGIV
jgi:hypothetical protein